MFQTDGKPILTEEALRRIAEAVSPIGKTEDVSLKGAVGRILGADITSSRAVPNHNNAAVDGFAFRHSDVLGSKPATLRVAGKSAAGHPFTGDLPKNTAIEIYTGAIVPDELDTVAMIEDCSVGQGSVTIPQESTCGDNVRPAGEDVQIGTRILEKGVRLRPQEIGLIASIGLNTVPVSSLIRVALFSTGDEIAEPGDPIPEGGVYDANRYALAGMLGGLPVTVNDLGILPDDLAAIRGELRDAGASHDLVITSGGVSMGGEDHVKAVLTEIGNLNFWRLAIKPGRPLAMGQIGETPFVGMPGNPVAAMITFLRFVRPLILRLAGAIDLTPKYFQVIANFDYEKKLGRREWLRSYLKKGKDGRNYAEKFEREGSGILSSMVAADGLIELPEDLTHVEKGQSVDFLPFSSVMT